MARIQHVSLNDYRQGRFKSAEIAIRIVDDPSLFGEDQLGMLTHRFVFSDVDECHVDAIQSAQAEQIIKILQSAQQANKQTSMCWCTVLLAYHVQRRWHSSQLIF